MKKTSTLLIASTLFFASCSDSNKEAGESASTEISLPTELILKEEPAGPVSIATLRTSGKAGDAVVFHGKLMGKDPVFMDSRAVMVVGDPEKLTSCDLKPDDECPTPWDVCCDDPAVVTSSILTVQVVDEEGRLLPAGLKGLGGMEELSLVSVVGEIDESSSESNMLVNATGFYVHPVSEKE